jgi:hypothetical protein
VIGDRWLVVGVNANEPFDGFERVFTIHHPPSTIHELAEQR